MSYKVQITAAAETLIREWDLPQNVLSEIETFLLIRLPQNPAQHLRRVHFPVDILQATFSCDDPNQPFATYTFIFRVVFSQNEENLVIVDAGYLHQRAI